MSDLISRNDAVEAIEFEKVYMTAYKGSSNGYVSEGNPLKQYNKGLDDAIKAINSLPTAEPEWRWIPVTEALPKNYEQTICIDSRGKMMIGMYGEYGWTFPCYMTEPVAWMPLPEPV